MGTITKFTPENGYPTTFYRVDNGNETRYVSAEEVLVSDDKSKVAKKSEVKGKNIVESFTVLPFRALKDEVATREI